MNNFIIYSIEIAISLALFYTAYWVFLKNETFFKLNRIYLIASVIISLLTPLLNISIGQDSFIKNLILPIDQYEQSIMGNTPLENVMKHGKNYPNIIGNKAGIADDANIIGSAQEKNVSSNSSEASSSNKNINWLTIVLAIYFIGAALFLTRFVANFIWIFGYVLKNKPQQIFGMNVIKIEKNISPFSFLNFMFISNKDYPEAELTKIISHEKVHIKQKHSIDLILFELLLVVQWFNPFVWSYKRVVKINHEYLADEGTLNSGIDMPGYQYSLLNQALNENNFEITNSYNFSIKKRIEMMMKKRSAKLAVLKLTIALPILIFLFSAFAFNTASSIKEVEPVRIAYGDTSIKKVNVPAEYLKLLQGEYVSTNEPGRTRRVIFSELLGTLFGYDDGYTYQIIPVGGEKFINPDDKATIDFNSNDKTAIKLVMFGRVNLNKVNYIAKINLNKVEKTEVKNRSMAFTLANVMLKDGIPAGLAYYKKAKDSSNYFITEIDMSYAGSQLIENGKTKEAIALLKLDTEKFPDNFNAYDTYAEALLKAGDKTNAKENFKKSVQLNPGSQNGLKRLKELGVNPDDLVKSVKASVEELKLLEGVYASTNEPNRVRRILFTEVSGVLHGWDAGYAYKIIPMGDGKFINPDDGASLVFNTKNKNAITLLLFGTVNLKRVKTLTELNINSKKDSIKVAKEILLKYSGEYIDERMNALSINLNGESLYRHMNNGFGDARLIPISINKFIYDDYSGRSMEFATNKDGEVLSLTISSIDGVFTYKRKK
ncbi:MAG: M56 family metallopeptidase [Bacteroidota bacterium]|nr:M56 family metallopeptidase [Bacteroidota bacterium]